MSQTYTNNDPREFMHFKGEWYINGTEITLTEGYMRTHKFNGKKLWKYAKFHHVTRYNGQTAYFFCKSKCFLCDLLELGYRDLESRKAVEDDYAPYFVVTAFELEYAIDEFVKPIKLSTRESDAIQKGIENIIDESKSDWNLPELRGAWLVYIAAMIGALLFNYFYVLWIVITFIFVAYRMGVIEK